MNPDRIAISIGDDEIAERFGFLDATKGSQHQFPLPLVDDSTRRLDVLVPKCHSDFFDGHAVSSQFIDIDPDIDGSTPPARQEDVADAGYRLQRLLDLSLCNLSDFANIAIARNADGHDGGCVQIELTHDGNFHPVRQSPQHRRDLVPSFLSPNVATFFEYKTDNDRRGTLAGDRSKFIDTRNGIDGFFDRLGDGRFHFLDTCTRQSCGDRNDREIDFGEQVHAELVVGYHPQNNRDCDQHPSEYRAADANV